MWGLSHERWQLKWEGLYRGVWRLLQLKHKLLPVTFERVVTRTCE